MASAHEASKIHRERTGKGLKISVDIVRAEEMYDEEEEAPRQYAMDISNLPGRFQTYASIHRGIASQVEEVEREFARAFGNFRPTYSRMMPPAQAAASFSYGQPSHPAVVPNPQATATQPPPPPSRLVRAAAPGPLQVPNNGPFLDNLDSVSECYEQASPYSASGTQSFQAALAQHSSLPHQVSPSFDMSSPTYTRSGTVTPLLHTPVQTPGSDYAPQSAGLERSRSGSTPSVSFEVPEVAQPHRSRHDAAAHQHGQRAQLHRQQHMLMKERQRSEGSLPTSYRPSANRPRAGGADSSLPVVPDNSRRRSVQAKMHRSAALDPRFSQLPAPNVQQLSMVKPKDDTVASDEMFSSADFYQGRTSFLPDAQLAMESRSQSHSVAGTPLHEEFDPATMELHWSGASKAEAPCKAETASPTGAETAGTNFFTSREGTRNVVEEGNDVFGDLSGFSMWSDMQAFSSLNNATNDNIEMVDEAGLADVSFSHNPFDFSEFLNDSMGDD